MTAARLGLTDEQLALRRTGITATDIVKLAHLSGYGGPLDVWKDKRGEVEAREMSEPAKWGLKLEAVIADERLARLHAEGRDRCRLLEPGTLRSSKRPIMLATLDRVVEDPATETAWDLEIKTAGLQRAGEFGEPGTDVIPDEYIAQVTWQLAVSELPFAELAVLIGGQDFKVFRIERDATLENELIDIAMCFWRDHIEGGHEPDIDGSEQWRDELRRRYPRATRQALLPASAEAADWAGKLYVARDSLRTWEQREQEAKNHLMAFIGDAEGIHDESFKATFRNNKDSEVVDWKGIVRAISARFPSFEGMDDIVREHTTTKPGARVLRVTFPKGE